MESTDIHLNQNSGLETNNYGALPESTGCLKDQSTSGQDLTECDLQHDMLFDEMRCCSNHQGFFDSSLSSQDQILPTLSSALTDSGVLSTPPRKVSCKNDSWKDMSEQELQVDSSESHADSLEHEYLTDPIRKDLSPDFFELDPDSLSHSTKLNQESLNKKRQMNTISSETPTNSLTQVIDGQSHHPIDYAKETNLGTVGDMKDMTRVHELSLATQSPSSPVPKKAPYNKLETSVDQTLQRNIISSDRVCNMTTDKEKNVIASRIQAGFSHSLMPRHAKLINESMSPSSIDSDTSGSNKSMHFFVDISTMPEEAVKEEVQENLAEKKNIFSIYIEVGDNSKVKEMPQNLSSSLNSKKIISSNSVQQSGESSTLNCSIEPEVISDEKCEKAIHTSSGKELAIVPSIFSRDRRERNKKILSKYSWITRPTAVTGDDDPQQLIVSQKRSQIFNLGSSDPKIGKYKTKDSVTEISPDDYTYSKSDISSFSSNSKSCSLPAIADDDHSHVYRDAGAAIDGSDINVITNKRIHQHEAELDQSFFNSLTCSTDNELSNDTSSTITDKNGDEKSSDGGSYRSGSLSQLYEVMQTHDLDSTAVFVEVEKVCKIDEQDSDCSVSDIVELFRECRRGQEKTSKTKVKNTMDNLKAVIERQKQILAADEEAEIGLQKRDDAFVKLSDLDRVKTVPKTFFDTAPEQVISYSDKRMSRSIPEPTCKDQNKGAMSRSTEVFDSFHSENTTSLGRLFPQLKEELSRSCKNSPSTRPDTSLRQDDQPDISEISSLQSSSWQSNNEYSSTSYKSDTSQYSCGLSNAPNQQTRLGEDLLRMFTKEIAADVIIEADGQRVKAHKCILASRCQYFAAMLSGGWVEKAGNVIKFNGYSFNSVNFALRHIYSGTSEVPDSIPIVELVKLADMLGLEGLKEVIMDALRVKYCHMFHKPCSQCTAGVLECLPLCAAYGLDLVYRKSLVWISKYFVCIWPTKHFAKLPVQLLDKCYRQKVINMYAENVLAIVSGNGRVVSELPRRSWAAPVQRLCQRLMNFAVQFIATHLHRVLNTAIQGDLPKETLVGVGADAIEDNLIAAIKMSPAEELCLSYQLLANLMNRSGMVPSVSDETVEASIATKTSKHVVPGTELEWRLVDRWMRCCESEVVRNLRDVTLTKAWLQLDPELKRNIKQSSSIAFGGRDSSTNPLTDRSETNLRSKPRTPTKHSSPSGSNGSVRNERTPKKTPTKRSLSSTPNQFCEQQLSTIKKKTSQLPRDVTAPRALLNPPAPSIKQEQRKQNTVKTYILQEIPPNIQQNHLPKSKKYQNVLPRYLEPRPNRLMEASNSNQNLKPNEPSKKKVMTSSESSCNSIPGFVRTESKKDMKGSNCKIEESSTKESSPVPGPSNASKIPRMITRDGKKYSTRSNIMLQQAEIVSTERISRPKTKSVTNIKASQGSQHDITSGKLSVRRDLSEPTTRTAFSPKPKKQNSTASPSEKKNQSHTAIPVTLAGTLMRATKSSSAKMVAKTTNSNQKPSKSHNNTNVQSNMSEKINEDIEGENIGEIPVMERSGTFLKEEPSVVGKSGEMAVID